MLLVNEIFHSIQGEGQHAGVGMTFVRFSGCDMNCSFCDTDHQKGVKMQQGEIMEAVKDSVSVCLTGGEPMIQQGVGLLIGELLAAGKKVHIETNGRHPIPHAIDCWIACSPKLWEGEAIDQLPGLKIANEVKIISNQINIYTDKGKPRWESHVITQIYYIQVLFLKNKIDRDELVRSLYFIKAHPEWRVNMQMHKLIGVK